MMVERSNEPNKRKQDRSSASPPNDLAAFSLSFTQRKTEQLVSSIVFKADQTDS